MDFNILLKIKTESGDEHLFMLKRPLSNKEFDIFVKDNLPDEYDKDFGNTICESEYINLDSIKKINI